MNNLIYNKATKSFSEVKTFSLADRVKYMKKDIKVRLRSLIAGYIKYYKMNPSDADILRKMLSSDLANIMVEAAPLLAESNNISGLLGLSSLPVDVRAEAVKLQLAYRKSLIGGSSTYNKFIQAYTEFITALINGIIR